MSECLPKLLLERRGGDVLLHLQYIQNGRVRLDAETAARLAWALWSLSNASTADGTARIFFPIPESPGSSTADESAVLLPLQASAGSQP